MLYAHENLLPLLHRVEGFWCEMRNMVKYIILSEIHIMYVCLDDENGLDGFIVLSVVVIKFFDL